VAKLVPVYRSGCFRSRRRRLWCWYAPLTVRTTAVTARRPSTIWCDQLPLAATALPWLPKLRAIITRADTASVNGGGRRPPWLGAVAMACDAVRHRRRKQWCQPNRPTPPPPMSSALTCSLKPAPPATFAAFGVIAAAERSPDLIRTSSKNHKLHREGITDAAVPAVGGDTISMIWMKWRRAS
jgi:hypothetical protein